ncbi:hypothetical protein C8R43DRAFT_822058, partial [Mycena crocata]
LPAKPKIFHGRLAELDAILGMLKKDSAKIAILGGGGMGKTSLALTALHHPEISAKFEHRFFVMADSSNTSAELVAQIGLHLGLGPRKNLTKTVLQYFCNLSHCLLVLDNLETPWEPLEARGEVEQFLSLLS